MQPKPVPTMHDTGHCASPCGARAAILVPIVRPDRSRDSAPIEADPTSRRCSRSRPSAGLGTKVVFENDQVRVWVLRLAPGERSAVHQHDLDHLLIQIRGDRIAVEPEPDAQGPHREYMEAPVIPGMVVHVPEGRDRDRGQRRRRAVLRDHRGAEGLGMPSGARVAACGSTHGVAATWTLEFPYRRSVGPVIGAFLTGLRERRGRGCAHRRRAGVGAAVRVRPRDRRARVGDGRRRVRGRDRARGVGAGAAAHAPARPAVRVGAREARRRRHALAARARLRCRPNARRSGTRVRIRWAAETTGHLSDIECFELEGSA